MRAQNVYLTTCLKSRFLARYGGMLWHSSEKNSNSFADNNDYG